MSTEADTCRRLVLPQLYAARWDDDQIAEQRTFTDGRIIVSGNRARRRKQKRADYLLKYRPDFTIAVVEAKPDYKNPGDGLQQAKDYAEILGLKFAYATNGHGIVEHDFITGKETDLAAFPTPDDLWNRLKNQQKISDDITAQLFEPYYHLSGKSPRYYQEIAINRAVQAILQGKRRALLTLATGTGKTVIAFQICWKLWNSRWNRTGEYRRPRILYLADRNVLVDDPKDKTFAPFGHARHKIEGDAVKSREMYFATYQAIAHDSNRPGLYRDYPPDFFDLIVIDECHRGSAREESNWRTILDYFEPAYKLGMTATPLREDNRDTYKYFGNPLYIYSLRQGIDDGFLAPYRVHRIVPTVDATGWRPTQGELDRYGREIPDDLYGTRDFERAVSLKARTVTIARNLTDFLKTSGRFGKTIVFCVDQEHAEEMRKQLHRLNEDLTRDYPDYVARVVSDEGDIGRGHLSRFMDLESQTPAIVTTSQMLTTGVDVPTCANVVLVRVINSMTEFKQIIGRGTRVRDDYGKLFFNILDYTGSATQLFADPDFDGDPALISEEEMDSEGKKVKEKKSERKDGDGEEEGDTNPFPDPDPNPEGRRKYYYDGGQVEIAAHMVYELDPDGRQLRVVRFTDYTADKVRELHPTAAALRAQWTDAEQRAAIIETLEDRGITFEALAEAARQPDADPFDLLCHIAYNAPLRTRRERAKLLLREKKDFFDQYSAEARAVLTDILDKYVEHDIAQFKVPDILKVPPISDRGTILEVSGWFGGPERLREAIADMQKHLYAA
ncbi:MAG: DEAD/DEAH box helicase family protein [Bryobacteraceae bacterium]|nr:DEAD/DEAH box helicase family protein [Solibacteraceae bacterium]MCO5350095.1 DEAD/DEAH box helicase family protein [Bryobacteraceae bacterium]